MVIIETKRLYFRELEMTDFKAASTILQDIDVMYAWEHAFSDQEVLKWITENIKRYRNEGYSYWAVIEKSSEQLVGLIGIIEEMVETEKVVGIGYILKKSRWHMGYAYEGTLACLNYAQNTLPIPEITAQIRPDNLASRKLAEKLGMSIKKEFTKFYKGKKMKHLLYSKTV